MPWEIEMGWCGFWVLTRLILLCLGSVRVTLSRITAVASLPADELNTASPRLEITLAFSMQCFPDLPNFQFVKNSHLGVEMCPSSTIKFRYMPLSHISGCPQSNQFVGLLKRDSCYSSTSHVNWEVPKARVAFFCGDLLPNRCFAESEGRMNSVQSFKKTCLRNCFHQDKVSKV